VSAAASPQLRVAGDTHVGKVRDTNEDSMICDPVRGLYVVLDGMGGANAGDIASQTARDAIRDFVVQRRLTMDPKALLESAIQYGSAAVFQAAQQVRERHGMGTTVVACLVVDTKRVVIAHVGDSRAYLLRDGSLQRLSQDHSVVAELVAAGQITEDEAWQHPQRNVVTRVLGPEPTVKVDTFSLQAQPDDTLLLCSDGLTDMVAEEEVAAILAADEGCEQLVRKLIRSALAGGGEDNVTAIAFRMGEVDEADRTAAARRILTVDPDLEDPDDDGRPVRWRRVAAASAVALVVIALLGAGAVFGLRESHFVGANETTGRIEIYQGVPVDLFAGIKLYHPVYASPVTYASLDPQTRKELFDHRLRSLDSARDAVKRIEEGSP